MRTFHIIGINLQLRLGIHMRIVRNTKIVVTLISSGFLRSFFHQNPSAENACRLFLQDILKQFVAGAVRHGMIEKGKIVGMLFFIAYCHPPTCVSAYSPTIWTDNRYGYSRCEGWFPRLLLRSFCWLQYNKLMRVAFSNSLPIRKGRFGILFCGNFYYLCYDKMHIVYRMIANQQFTRAFFPTMSRIRRLTFKSTPPRRMLISCNGFSTTVFSGTYTTKPSWANMVLYAATHCLSSRQFYCSRHWKHGDTFRKCLQTSGEHPFGKWRVASGFVVIAVVNEKENMGIQVGTSHFKSIIRIYRDGNVRRFNPNSVSKAREMSECL